ncbi:starch-binding protein associating with outer membrane [Bacteroidales bacterium 6E]|nr:starch-binding protein associating with outer membrane [Bacteroidales bacterium 6E]
MKTKIAISIIFSLTLLMSCNEDKYLDLYPLTRITEGNYYSSQLQLEQALNDVYRQLGRVYSAHGLPDLFGEQTSDNTRIIIKSGGDNFSEQINDFWILTDNGRIREAWDVCYNAIYVCNNIIDKLDNTNIEVDQTVKNRMVSEALAVRSLIYFNMVRAWGDVPLVLNRITPSESYKFLREPTDKIYLQIIGDLMFAKQNLPEKYTGINVGRVTKFGVSAILAKVYMTIGENQSARSELEYIINSGAYSLDSNKDGDINFADFKFLFHPSTKNCHESVLEVQYLAGANAFNSNHQNVYAPFSHAFNLVDLGVASSIFRGEGINTPAIDLINEFEENDPRKAASIFPGFTNQATKEFVEYPFTLKFFDPNWTNPGKNFAIIRYADILLMYAEITNDVQYLNMVRSRVGLPGFGSEGYPSEKYPTLNLAIEHERRVELCFEFHRFFDLKRTGRAIQVMTGKGFNVNADKLFFPIPQNAIDVNPALVQNSGY